MNGEKRALEIEAFIKAYMRENGSPEIKVVCGVSGGKDSTIAAALLVRALGKERVIGVLMPQGTQNDIADSYRVCELLGIKHYEINIGDTCNTLYAVLPSVNPQIETNTPARVRMATLYAIAAIEGARVVNTGNRSEAFVGYTTKWGDSAGDFALFTEYTVREVLEIGDALGLPYDLVHKAPADGMSGKTDEDNLGFTYEDVDSWLLDGVEPPQIVFEKNKASWHKRATIDLPHPLNM